MDKKLIFIDLDGTLTPRSTWLELNLTLGITAEEDHALFQQYLESTLNYEDWNRALVQLYKSRSPVTKAQLLAFAETVELRPDAISTVKALQEKGYRVVVLSGSVDLIAETVAKRIGANDWRSTSKLKFDEQGILIDIIASGDEAPAKEKLAEAYVATYEYTLSDSYTIDDGGNGIELFKRMKGILLGNNKTLEPIAWKQVQPLSEIPALL